MTLQSLHLTRRGAKRTVYASQSISKAKATATGRHGSGVRSAGDGRPRLRRRGSAGRRRRGALPCARGRHARTGRRRARGTHPPSDVRAHARAAGRRAGRFHTDARILSVDELCPPEPVDGYFWRQIQKEFVSWTGVPSARCRPFAVDAADLAGMCEDYEAAIAEAGGLDLVMLGLGLNAHIACHEPRADFTTR